MQKILRICALIAIVLLIPLMIFAQTETGQITGTVTDQTGAVVPNATVTVTRRATMAVRTVTTGDTGQFVVTNLLPATYTVKTVAEGFNAVEQDVVLHPGAKVGLDVKLEVGKTTTVVEVAGGAATTLVNTVTPTISESIDTQFLTMLPIQSIDNPYSLVLTSGNVSEDDPTGRGAGVAINGLRSESTNVLLDGAANNDEFVGAYGQKVPADSVQEYNLLLSNFTAEYGRAGAGVVNLTTKSGTNNFHGTAYEYGRYSKLASNDFNNNAYGLAKGIYTRNQFGYSVGGPIKKNKLFFFQSTEWLRIRSSAPQINYLVDPALLTHAASNTQAFFSSRGTLKPGVSTIKAYTRGDLADEGADPCQGKVAPDPCGSLPMSQPMFDKVTYGLPADAGAGYPTNTYDLVGRVDWNIGDNTTFYSRYAFQNENDFPGYASSSAYSGYDVPNINKNSNILLSVTHSFSASLVSQSKLVFNRLNNVQPYAQQPPTPGLYFNSAVETDLLGQPVVMPGYNPTTPGSGIPFGGPQNFLQLYQDMSKIQGKHGLRFGVSYTYVRDNRTFGAYENPVASLSTGSVNDAAMDRLLTGVVRQLQAAVDPQGKYPCVDASNPDPSCTLTLPVGAPNFSRSNRYNELGLYLQDSWKVASRLALNLGVRWEYFGSQHNKNPNLDSNFYLASAPSVFLGIAQGGVTTAPNSPMHGLWGKDWNNFGPRLGFAYDVFGDGKTSIRGGWGISYIRNFGNVTFNVIQNPPNYAVVSLIGGIDVPSIPITTDVLGPLAGTSGTKALPAVSLRAVNPDIKTAYTHNMSFGVQRELVPNVVLDLEYSGSKGVGLYDIANINRYGSANVYLGQMYPCPAPPCYDRLKATQYTNINYRSDEGFSRYHSLNTRLDIRNVKGVNFRINYTWSHAIDNLSDTFSSSNNDFNLGYLDPFDPKVDTGDAQFDNRHRISVSGAWLVPFAKNTHGVAKQILDGWTFAPIITARTGNPYAIYDCTNAVTVCMRMAETTPLPRSPQTPAAVPGIPNDFNILSLCSGAPTDFTGCKFDSSYANPIVGYSDFGPWPSNMTGRDAFRSPGDWNVDFGIHKNFFLTEKYNLEFRGEFFNTFNHANFYASSGGAEVETQPYIPASYYGHRNVQLALRFTF